MKELLAFSLMAFLCLSASATILRVNNSPGSNAPYTDFLTAHAVAQTDDTIHLEGSNMSYGTLTLTKRLVIIGPGYFQAQNPCTPASLPATTGEIVLQRTATNDPFSGAAGSQIIGISVNAFSVSNIEVYVSNATVSKCLVNENVYIRENDVSGTQVFQCFFYGGGLATFSTSPGISNFVFVNNIVGDDFRLPDNSSGVIHHNLFLGDRFNVEIFNGEIRSNIATSTNTTNFAISVSSAPNLSHNTAANGQFGTNNNNTTAPVSILFVGLNSNSEDGQYQLLPTAPAKNNAHDGTDRGPYGGNAPYMLSGVPNIPFLKRYEIITPSFPGDPFQVKIQAQSGN